MKWIRQSLMIGAATALMGSPAAAQVCANSVQGKIAWSKDGRTDWNPDNIETLCAGQESSLEPGKCFAGFIEKGFGWSDALKVCEGVSSSVATKNCYESSKRNEKKTKAQRIAKCNVFGKTSEPEPVIPIVPDLSRAGITPGLMLDPKLVANLARQEAIKDLKITSQNMWFLNAGPVYMVSDNNSERMENIRRGRRNGTFLAGQDIVVLNELFDHDYIQRVYRTIAREYPHRTPVAGRANSRDYWDEDLGQYVPAINNSGVSIISKWPIVEKVQFLLPDSSRPSFSNINNMPGRRYLPDNAVRNPDFLCSSDTLANKGFVYVKIMYKNEIPVHVIGTHTQAADDGCDGYDRLPAGHQIGWRQRNLTFKLIRKFLDERNIPDGEAIFVAGDLNVMKGTNEYTRMIRTLDAVDPTVTGHDATWDPATNRNIDSDYRQDKPQFLDYVLPIQNGFSPANWNNHVVKTSAYSDHYGVEGAVRAVSNPIDVDPDSYVDYRISFRTGSDGTDSDVHVMLIGDKGRSNAIEATELIRGDAFESGDLDHITIRNTRLGDLKQIRLRIDNEFLNPDWEVINIRVRNMRTGQVKEWRGSVLMDESVAGKRVVALDLN